MCKCKNKEGEIVEVPAKMKEMVYRMQSPDMQQAVFKAKQGRIRLVESGCGSK